MLAINEWGTYIDPNSSDSDSLKTLTEEKRQAQDDELYSRARLVNCVWFTRVILQDYVGAILGLPRDGEKWRLNPVAVSISFDSFAQFVAHCLHSLRLTRLSCSLLMLLMLLRDSRSLRSRSPAHLTGIPLTRPHADPARRGQRRERRV